MSSFRRFLAAHPLRENVGRMPAPSHLGGVMHSGPLNLPDLSLGNIWYEPGETPPGGFSSFGQYAQTQIDKRRYGSVEEVQKAETLRKLGVVANNVVIIQTQNDPQQKRMTERYKLARYDERTGMISGLTLRGLTSDGDFPELRKADLDIGQQVRVIIQDPYPPDPAEVAAAGLTGSHFYAIDVRRLSALMHEMQHALRQRQQGYKHAFYGAGKLDQALDTMSQGGQVALGHNVNPLR